MTGLVTSVGLYIQQYDVANITMMNDSVVSSKVVMASPCIGREIQLAVNHNACNIVRSLFVIPISSIS
jgi:hypothetical protein